MAELRWLNHASFTLEHRGTVLVCDPWLDGTAFDGGWAHLSRSAHPDWQSVTHLWISHEHPDHFAPRTLLSIPLERRQQITVLYQSTRDRKLVNWCEAKGFQVREVDGEVELAPEFAVGVHRWTNGDSYLTATVADVTVLNLNDCVIHDHLDAATVARSSGPVDVLMTQFSYANWVGNPDEPEKRQRAAQTKLERVAAEVQALEPRFVVPFASFIWFCHEENVWMNDCVVPVDRAAKAIVDAGAAPVVLYPGDTWNLIDDVDNRSALERYDADQSTIAARTLQAADSVALAALGDHADQLVRDLTNAHSRPGLIALKWLRRLPAYTAWLTDHEIAVQMDLGGLRQVETRPSECDITLGSQALDFCLSNLFGGSTLRVNGRFTAPEGGDIDRFWRWQSLAEETNRGTRLIRPWPLLARKGQRAAVSARKRFSALLANQEHA